MSQIKVKGNASGTGVFTIESPATNTDRTLTLPDAAGTVDRLERAGNVLQVVNATLSGSVSTTSSTRSDIGLSATITPSSASNKILVFVHIAGNAKNGGAGSGPYISYWLMRGSTDIIKFEGEAGYTANTSQNSVGACSTTYLDSPNTTSATTYKVQFNNPANAGTVALNSSGSISTMIVMEIAA